MTFLGFRLKKIEDRIAPSIRESFVIVIGGMEADSEGNYTVPHIDVPGAEVITIEASPETMKWLAEQEARSKQREREDEERKRLAEIAKEDEDPLLADYPLPENMRGVDESPSEPERPIGVVLPFRESKRGPEASRPESMEEFLRRMRF